jgi:histidine triad (HIT) family protein
MSCVFCEIVEGRREAHKIYENKDSLVILDVNPLAKGHCLAVSKRHVQWWYELEETEVSSLFNAAKIVSEKIMRVLKPDFVTMYARGRRIPHVHIFLIPTFSGDVVDRFFNTLEGFQESVAELSGAKLGLGEVSNTLRKDL